MWPLNFYFLFIGQDAITLFLLQTNGEAVKHAGVLQTSFTIYTVNEHIFVSL